MEKFVYKIIPLAEISREFRYSGRYSFEDPVLLESVKRRGILKPIVITAGEKEILSGHKRLWAAANAGLKEIPVFEVSGIKNPADLYLLAVFLNWNQAFRDLDRAFIMERAISNFKMDEKTVAEEILPAIGLEPQSHFLKDYLEIMHLEPLILEAVDAGNLPFRGVSVLHRFSKPDQADFVKCVAMRAALTTNQLLKAGEWLFDLLKSKGIPLIDLLKSSGLETLLETSQDRRQKGEKFCEAVRALRFPQLSKKEEEFHSLAGKIKEGETFSLEAPSFFEEQGLTLRAKLKNPESLDHLAAVLERKRKLFNSLFDIML